MNDEQHNDSASLAECIETARAMGANGPAWLYAQMQGHAEELPSIEAAAAAIKGE